MRAILAPTLDPQVVYQTCVNGIADENLRSRLNLLVDDIAAVVVDYQKKGMAKQLYTIPPNNCEDDDVALGAVTKKEFKSLYGSHMVGKTKPARKIYDSLLSTAPLGRCPFCGIGYASTLDHYLPKTKYPQLSVVPLNLVPSCKDCNTGKSAVIATLAEEQCLHPYFDHDGFVSEQWLFAEVVPSTPETFRYFVRAPKNWDDISRRRVQSHFEDFNLAKRYATEAANELAGRKQFLDEYKRQHGSDALVDLLHNEAISHSKNHVNSWQTAFYQALASFNIMPDKKRKPYFCKCPVCDGECIFINHPCPCCNGDGCISSSSLGVINMSFYEKIKCPYCDGNTGCSTCGGKGLIDRLKALKLTRDRP